MKKILTALLSAVHPVGHGLNGGDGLNSATIYRYSDGCFGHNGFIHLKCKEGDISY